MVAQNGKRATGVGSIIEPEEPGNYFSGAGGFQHVKCK